jgi:NAD(P)-dependent dehydrogenase (short-subunit alcohol dehydrogenase family)
MAVISKSKIAIVTGGSRGLGKDMALSLARHGIDVILTYHTQKQEADKVADTIRGLGLKASALPFDVSRVSTFDAFLGQVKTVLRETWNTEKVDFLINNVGIGKAVPIKELTEDDFDTFLNIHFKGVVFLTQKTLEMMNDGGGVVFITAAGDRYIVPGYAAYASCKGAVEVFARYVAKEYGPRGIRANTVAPGGIETDFNNGFIRNNPQLRQILKAQTALGRVGAADDIGGVVAFLCGDDAKWLTGQRLEVTGGFNL